MRRFIFLFLPSPEPHHGADIPKRRSLLSSITRTKTSSPFNNRSPGPQNPAKPLVWLIFGATGHMGRSLVKTALANNDLVAAVGRTYENSPAAMKELESANCIGLLCDVRARETVKRVIDQTITRFGRIDIIANCSGYGVIGACEDQDEFDIRNQFETNFTGTLNMIQLSLPHFRQRRAGRYLIFSSTSGALGVPGLGPYCASKYAVEGLMESMLYEVDSFNIKGTLVEPGHMRRDDIGDLVSPSAVVPNPSEHQLSSPLPLYGHFLVKPPSEPYNTVTSPAAHARRMLMWLGDKQPASAVKAAHLVWQLGHCSYPPLRLILGTYAVESIRDRLKCIIEEIEDWKYLSFPMGETLPVGGRGGSSFPEGAEGGANWVMDNFVRLCQRLLLYPTLIKEPLRRTADLHSPAWGFLCRGNA